MSLIIFVPLIYRTIVSHFVSDESSCGGIISCKMTGEVRYPSHQRGDESFMDTTYLMMESIENECKKLLHYRHRSSSSSSSLSAATTTSFAAPTTISSTTSTTTTATTIEEHPSSSSISSSSDDVSSYTDYNIVVDESQSSSLDFFFQEIEQQFETSVDDFIQDIQDMMYPQEETTHHQPYDYYNDHDDDGLKEELAALECSFPFEQTLNEDDGISTILLEDFSLQSSLDFYQKIETKFETAVDEYVQDLRMMSQETTTWLSYDHDDDSDDDDDDGLKEELEALESFPPLFTTTGLDVDEMPCYSTTIKDDDFDFDQMIDNNTSSFSTKDLVVPSFQSDLTPDCVLMPYHSDHHCIMQLFDHRLLFIISLQMNHWLLALLVS